MMTHLTLIVPFSVPPGAEEPASLAAGGMTDAVLRQLELPALGKLLTRGRTVSRERHGEGFDPTALRSLPHQRWLATRAGLPVAPVPAAPYMRLADRTPPGQSAQAAEASDGRAWTCLEPVHLHAARDHLVLGDPAQLRIRADEAQALHAAIAPLLDETGIPLEMPLPERWYLPEAVFGPLDATPPLRAAGRNIDIWMQRGERERDWRRLQNEIQMTWHDHPVNQAREARGEPTVNSVWLHGGGVLRPVAPLAGAVFGDEPLLRGLALAGGARALPASASFDSVRQTLAAGGDGDAMVQVDTTTTAWLEEDWGRWIEQMHALEASWFAPMLAALQEGQLRSVALVLCGDHHYAQIEVQRGDLRKFWRGLGGRGNWRGLLSDLALAA
ncbi:hypothetical protein [Cupriavidus sp. AU9028]|uniref:hypothetical protein n=1 Tax=Cupriavidus sp. AU9028 TaxID=2871157 RepID=UPI001C9728CF|nr:hypothetical protein [Cupriavidus sp. AU9028]MBY4898721.1 hypothetical protein [Cupriavidus sp. AU9028]